MKITLTSTGPTVSSRFGMSDPAAGLGPTGQSMTGPVGQGRGMGPGSGGGLGMGRGRGMGRGMGRGGGRGRDMGGGRGMGRAMGTPSDAPPISPPASFPQGTEPASREQELAGLKQQAELFEQQKRQLNSRIAQLESSRNAIVVVDSEKCTGCGICADVCPVRAIKVEGHAIVNPDMCTGCAACVAQCPQNAILLTQQKTGK